MRNTPGKLSSVLQNRTIRSITQLLEPYKRNPSDYLSITLTNLIHCYDRTHKLLKSLDLDSKRITQSSQGKKPALEESMTTLFISTNLQQIFTQVIQIPLILPPIDQYWTLETYMKIGNIFLFYSVNLCDIISFFKPVVHAIFSCFTFNHVSTF